MLVVLAIAFSSVVWFMTKAAKTTVRQTKPVNQSGRMVTNYHWDNISKRG